ncbi:MAG: protein phosphatase 2C domain-containing protein [Blastocatellia bacterium]|nr:protein phosphatase 2C domain-containing protein [Blastocatellia bacterium]
MRTTLGTRDVDYYGGNETDPMAISTRRQSSGTTMSVFARTSAGRNCHRNDDAFLVTDLTTGNWGLGPDVTTHRIGACGSLVAVSDGLGGAAAGEVASELAVLTLRESLAEMPQSLSPHQRLRLAVEMTNYRIWNHAGLSPGLRGMGAALTAALIHESTAYIAQIGHSRAYLIRGERIKQLTVDQSFAQIFADAGTDDLEKIGPSLRNKIAQALGTQPRVQVAMTSVELNRDDHLLVCSNGLYNNVSPLEMMRAVHETASLRDACLRLMERAAERGGDDSLTVVIARFEGDRLKPAAGCDITSSYEVISRYRAL